jgi:hypothetical protein
MALRRLGLTFLAVGAIAFGIVAGLGSAYWAVTAGPRIGALTVGPWIAEPEGATIDADPYALARRIQHEHVVPLGSESLTFVATRDTDGAALDGRCDYRVEGPSPAARVWTLTATDLNGQLINSPARRHTFTVSEIVRLGPDDLRIAVSARAWPGNWLPVAEGPFMLVLRLYDTAVGAGFGVSRLVFPAVVREGCR